MKKSVKIKNKVKLNDKKNHLRFSFVIICSVLLVLILFVVGFKGYNTVTGKVPYYNPLTPEELSLGVQLKKGSNTIIWSD